jgi:phosphoribosylglycinamide formyltransferase 1
MQADSFQFAADRGNVRGQDVTVRDGTVCSGSTTSPSHPLAVRPSRRLAVPPSRRLNVSSNQLPMTMTRHLRIACLISGGGRTVLNLADHIEDGSLPATIAIVISSRADAPGVQRAKERRLPTGVIDHESFRNFGAMHDAVTDALIRARVDLVCLAGYLRWMRIDEPFQGRIINIHPALLPKFGGKGMYGLHVHRAVLEAGEKESGCTVHFVDEEYDHGPTILQRTCPVMDDDTPESLAARVFEQECIAYPEAIRLFAQRRVNLVGSEVEILPPRETTSE